MIVLHNDRLTVSIDPKGAQLCSVKAPDGTEYIWQADPAIWNRHAPLLFPVIGRLADSSYTLNDKTYTIGAHGFCRDALFTVARHDDTTAVFQLTDSPDTLAVWPFRFVLTVTFTLADNKLKKSVKVENRSGDTMYFELGGHDGFNAPLSPGETMSDYAVVLPGVEELHPYGMDEACMMLEKSKVYPLDHGRIDLKPYHYDGLDTVVLDLPEQATAMLVDKSGKARVTVECPDYTFLALWTQNKPFDTNYVCIEPWTTMPDARFCGRGLNDKRGIRTLGAGKNTVIAYTTTFN